MGAVAFDLCTCFIARLRVEVRDALKRVANYVCETSLMLFLSRHQPWPSYKHVSLALLASQELVGVKRRGCSLLFIDEEIVRNHRTKMSLQYQSYQVEEFTCTLQIL